jgi:hypothetical protein
LANPSEKPLTVHGVVLQKSLDAERTTNYVTVAGSNTKQKLSTDELSLTPPDS